jgi:hypothetical protein
MIGPEQAVAEHKRDQRRTGVLWIAVAIVLLVSLGFVYRSDHQVEVISQRSGTLERQVVANGQLAQEGKAAAEEANRRLRAAGKPTVPVPSVTPISPPPSTAEVDALTVEQVRAIVVTELAQHKSELSQAEINQVARVAAAMVPKPADGKTPTKAELQPMVVAALAAYCVGDKCVGKAGTDGKPGKDGRDGENGKDAPVVTDEQLLTAAQAALQAYCGQETQPCRGPQGEPGATVTGPPGATGPTGRGIADTDCLEDGTWRITYTDGTTGTTRGPCRIVLPPEKTGN